MRLTNIPIKKFKKLKKNNKEKNKNKQKTKELGLELQQLTTTYIN